MHESSETRPGASGQGATVPDPGRVTPMMAQYIEIKAANPDCLLFYRMGDFYELFFDDAEIASRTLGIVLTKRGKHQGEDIAMCGVPVDRADDYLQRLIAAGPPRRRLRADRGPGRGAGSAAPNPWSGATSCGSSRRARSPRSACSSPGRASLLRRHRPAPAQRSAALYGLAAIDISTGRFSVMETPQDRLGDRVRPSRAARDRLPRRDP